MLMAKAGNMVQKTTMTPKHPKSTTEPVIRSIAKLETEIDSGLCQHFQINNLLNGSELGKLSFS